jgi:hypothetical protein
MTPDDYRKRYEELKARAASHAQRPLTQLPHNPRVLSVRHVIQEEVLPSGWYWTRRIPRGQTLRIQCLHGTHGVSALFWNAEDPSERFNPADTIKVQWHAQLSRGRLLLSDMGRVLCSITDDTGGYHDFVAGGSTRWSDDAKFGADPQRRNTRDNFLLAAAKHGLSSRDVGPCATFFAAVLTDESGRFVWKEGAIDPTDFVDLRAEMDIIVALSNCPHPSAPIKAWAAEPVRLIVWHSPPENAEDYCRTATEESARAFENTDAYLTARAQ